jgi:integrase
LDYTAAGKRIREPGGNTEQEARAKLQEQLAKITLGQWTAPSRNTVGDAIDALLANWVTREVKSRVRAGKHLHQAKAEIGHIPLAKFQEAEADAWANTLAKKGYSRTTRDLKLRLLKAALKLALERQFIARVPKFPAICIADTARQGFVELEAFEAIVRHLDADHRDAVEFAYLVGWRRGEVTGLTWDKVFTTEIRLGAGDTKSKRPRVIPLDPALAEILARRQRARRLDCPFVFHRNGRPLTKSLPAAWGQARVAAGMPTILLHDLRRSAIRNMLNAGVQQEVIMRITGHQDPGVFRRYAIVNTEDLREAGRKRIAYLEARRARSTSQSHVTVPREGAGN